MFRKHFWQLVSDDSVWMFPADVQLSTVELDPEKLLGFEDYQYESCLFFINGNSDVIARYASKEEAIVGHTELEKQYGLKKCAKLKLRGRM